MVDRYTKAVLTVIAVALCALALQNAIPSAEASGDDCGSFFKPCHVKVQGVVQVAGR